MARIRSIKPSFFTSDNMAAVSIPARLLYIGLWTLADREGRLQDRPRRIRAEIMPYDEVDAEALLAELAGGPRPFIERYVLDGEAYIQIIKFADHQKPHPKEPPSVIPPAVESREKTRPAVEKHGEPRKGLVEPGGSMVSGSMVSGNGHGKGEVQTKNEDQRDKPAPPVRLVDFDSVSDHLKAACYAAIAENPDVSDGALVDAVKDAAAKLKVYDYSGRKVTAIVNHCRGYLATAEGRTA